MIVRFVSIIISIVFSFLLLSPEYEYSFQKYFFREWFKISIAILIALLPLYWILVPFDRFFFLFFVTTIITDCVENSVFTVIPLLLIAKQFVYFLWLGNWTFLGEKAGYTLVAFVLYQGISFIYYRYFNQTQVGGGDILFFLASFWYFSFKEILVSIYCGTCYGLLFLLIYNLFVVIYNLFGENKSFLRGVPFIPFFYLGINTVFYFNLIQFFVSYLF